MLVEQHCIGTKAKMKSINYQRVPIETSTDGIALDLTIYVFVIVGYLRTDATCQAMQSVKLHFYSKEQCIFHGSQREQGHNTTAKSFAGHLKLKEFKTI